MRQLLNNENWNIGFVEGLTAEKLLATKKLPKIKWMRHEYKDRAFADPYILSTEGKHLAILCEEIIFGKKGKISRLLVDKETYMLKDRKEVLELPTHLSYPAIIEDNGDVYIYPENGESGEIRKYRYDPEKELMEDRGILTKGALADFTICNRKIGGKWYALSSKMRPDYGKNAYLYYSENKLGIYTPVSDTPVADTRCSRPGGNFFTIGEDIYRPAQDCTRRYGYGLRIMHVKSFIPYHEEEILKITPQSFRYNLGIHTLNFGDGYAVTDGYGYKYLYIGIIARILSPINRWRLKLTHSI